MKIPGGQEPVFKLICPDHLFDILAFGTMPVPAGTIADLQVPAIITNSGVYAGFSCAAIYDSLHSPVLVGT